jgi:lysophospholipase L1-like esterase
MKKLIYILLLFAFATMQGQTQAYYSAVSKDKAVVPTEPPSPPEQTPFPDLTGMTMSVVGNSITECCTGCSFVYQKVLEDSMALGTITNKGVSGNTMAKIPGTRDGFRLQVQQSYGKDIISIFGGTNDWTFNVPLGDTTSHSDTNNIAGTVNYFIDLIQTNSPGSIIVFITPLSRGSGSHPVNSLGYTVEDYGNTIKAVCQNRNIRYLELFEINGLKLEDIGSWAADGLHPNNTGQMRLGRIIKYYLLNEDYKNLY